MKGEKKVEAVEDEECMLSDLDMIDQNPKNMQGEIVQKKKKGPSLYKLVGSNKDMILQIKIF